jgi:hypothetical protein
MTTTHDIEVAPELEGLDLRDRPDGPGSAAVIAAGIGIFVLGLFTLLSEVSEGIHVFLEDLDFGEGVGPLAGKTILATAAFFVSWAILGSIWRHKDTDIKQSFWVGLALGILGAILTFPPVFTAFA